MHRSWLWAVALGTGLIAPTIFSVNAASPASPDLQNITGHSVTAIQLAQRGGGGHGGGVGHGGGGGGFGGGRGGLGGGFGHGAAGGGLGRGGYGGNFGAGVFRGGAPRMVTPRFTPRVVSPRPRLFGQRGPRVSPRFTPRPGVIARSGAHYPRYRHRHGRFRYYYSGWWYAFPWWTENECEYWSDVCASQWGYDTGGYYSCMSYSGCY
jgi:hypothetical protein